MAFVPIPRRGLADQVADAIRDAIVGGSFRAGDPLPGERELAEQFSVNRTSVREAMQRLEVLGLVEVKHGGATRVADVLARAGLSVLPWVLAPGGRLDPAWWSDLLEVRVGLLGFTAELAARRADAADLSRLESTVDRLATARAPEAIVDGEFEFFSALLAAGRNRVLQLVGNAVREVYAAHKALFVGAIVAGPVDVTPHRRVLAAIVARDPEAAHLAGRAVGHVLGAPR